MLNKNTQDGEGAISLNFGAKKSDRVLHQMRTLDLLYEAIAIETKARRTSHDGGYVMMEDTSICCEESMIYLQVVCIQVTMITVNGNLIQSSVCDHYTL